MTMRLVAGKLLRYLCVLELNPQQLAQLFRIRLPASAQHLDASRVRRQQALADLDGGRLSGTIGPQQSKAFTGLDLEVQTIYGDDIVVRLSEALDLQCCSWMLA